METIRNVCKERGLTVSAVLSERRWPEVVDARREVALRLREQGWSYPRIGRALRRDHSTIYVLVNGKARAA